MVPPSWIAGLGYKPGWAFKRGGPGGGYLCVFARTPDSLDPARERTTQHMFKIPAEIDEPGFGRWVLDCVLLAEQHEACEFLSFGGVRRFWPHHQDEGDPYELVDRMSSQLPPVGVTLPSSDRAG